MDLLFKTVYIYALINKFKITSKAIKSDEYLIDFNMRWVRDLFCIGPNGIREIHIKDVKINRGIDDNKLQGEINII